MFCAYGFDAAGMADAGSAAREWNERGGTDFSVTDHEIDGCVPLRFAGYRTSGMMGETEFPPLASPSIRVWADPGEPTLLRRTVLHELGHYTSPGREHSEDPRDVMFSGGPTAEHLTASDVEWAHQ